MRAGTRELESDLAYTRYLGQGWYRYDLGRHHVQASGMAGGITGHAPLFERFTLGDSATLAGWDKYDIAPAGGDRVVYSSIEYRYTGLALFLDVGSVWDANTERRVRVSDRLRVPRRTGLPRRRLPAEHRQSARGVHDGSAPDPGAAVVASARHAAAVLLALVASAPMRVSAQTVTVDTVGDALRIHAPGFSFLKGEPLARLKDGRSVRVELAAAVLSAPGKSAAATTRRIFALSYDLWEERFAVTAVDARSRSVSHLTAAAAEAWCVEQLAVPVSALGALGRDLPFWIRLEYRILDGDAAQDAAGLRLHAAGPDRRVEPPPQDRVVHACPGGRSVQAAAARHAVDAVDSMTRLRTRLIAAFLASTLLPLGATVWITTSLLDRSLRYATTGELDRLSRTLENTAKQFYQRERDALKEDALAGRAHPTTYPAADASRWPEPVRSFWESGEPERFGVSGAGGERVDYMRRVDRPSGAPASRSTAVIWAASAWNSCPPSFDRRASSSTPSIRAICGADSR